MTDPFSSYLVIDAQSIVRSNIRPNHVKEDLTSLLEVLHHFDYLGGSNINEGFVLGRHIVERIDEKSGLLELLEYFGLERDKAGRYTYYSAESRRETERRKNGVSEVKRLSRDLKRARDGSLDGFREFIRNERPVVYNDPSDHTESDEEPPLPPLQSIEERNAKTLASIRSLKESLVTEYEKNPSASFIRRRLARLLLKQKHPDACQFEDSVLDLSIDARIGTLRQKHKQTYAAATDQVYIECLIRTNLDENEALKLLQTNPPKLEAPITPTVPETPVQTPLASVFEPLKQHYRLLNQTDNNNNRLARQFSRTGDAWDNIKHIVPAIQQIRQKNPGEGANDAAFSQLCRLIHSELLSKVSQQPSFMIEQFARLICDLPPDAIENLDIIAVKNIFSSSVSNFEQNMKSFLSIQCEICLTYYPRNQMETMFLCNHQFCLTCVKEYYRANIDNVQDIKSLTYLTCCVTRHDISPESYMPFFTHIEAKFNQWFKDEPKFLEKYNTRKFDATRSTQVKNCGGPKCASSFFVDENDPVGSSRCASCQFSQCRKCGKKWNAVHTKMTCDEYDEWLKHDDPEHPDNLALSFLGSNMIVCPKCNFIYEFEAGGCEDFTCERCETKFCRTCSSLYYSPKKDPKCPINNCSLKSGLHAHCPPNCYREIRDGNVNTIRQVLEDNGIDADEELQTQPISTNKKCPTNGCKNDTSAATQHRLCDTCYKYFLCSLIWTNHIEPWEIYENHNLQQLLTKASVRFSPTATREELIELCEQHLAQSLGTPRARPRL